MPNNETGFGKSVGSPNETGASSIHIWSIFVRPSDPEIESLLTILSADEKSRASRYRGEHLRKSFILARGALRILLGYYLDREPDKIQFLYGRFGKPRVVSPMEIRFNVSHSEERALFAFSRDCEIGIDIEKIRALPEMIGIANHFFCAEELSDLMGASALERERVFFTGWARKEAYLKGLGVGLTAPLDRFRVPFGMADLVRPTILEETNSLEEEWSLVDLKVDDQYAAACAYSGRDRALRISSISEVAELFEPMRKYECEDL